MNEYNVEHKISSLVQCAVRKENNRAYSFSAENINFSHWDFNIRDGWKGNAWIAKGKICSKDVVSAINTFRAGLLRIIPRVSLISQAYIEYFNEPFLLHRLGNSRALVRYVKDVPPVPLMFREQQNLALQELMNNSTIPESFYKYWNDVVNASGNSAKLLLMCAAVEALAKKSNGQKDWDLMQSVLGKDLKDKMYAQDGLRHRLSHGEYFGDDDSSDNYVELIHKKVIGYFNSTIFAKAVLNTNIVRPQRHFWGNKEAGVFYVDRKDGASNFSLKELLEDHEEGRFGNSARYKYADIQTHEGY